MKIGIMTFWWSEDNYGQILQCYALQKYLRDKGHEPFLIRYDPRNDIIPTPLHLKMLKALNPIKLFNYLYTKFRIFYTNKEQKTSPRFFSKFIDLNIVQSEKIYTSFEQLKNDPPKADMYIVGSDQVWNLQCMGGNLKNSINLVHAYFLDFGSSNINRVSYAASWGFTSISEEYAEVITPLLHRFDYISVREKSGIEICEQCGVKADWVPDPTLLLDADVYRDLYKNEVFEKPEKPYILLYILGNKSDFSMSSMIKWAKERDLDIKYVTGNSNFDSFTKTFSTIPQWLYLVDNAEYVITNSFHCCVFSSVFHKKFAVLPVKGYMKEMNSRLDSLWDLLKIKPRIINSNNLSVLDKPYQKHHIKKDLNYLDSLNSVLSIFSF